MASNRTYIEALERELGLHGVTSWAVKPSRRGHPRLCFEWHGRSVRFAFPGTPSDNKGSGLENCLSELRRVMQVKRVTKHSRAPKRSKSKPRQTVAPMAILGAWV